MFEELFSKIATVVQHRAAPFAVEREQFLRDCAKRGYRNDYLQKIAARLLITAYELKSQGGLDATPAMLIAAADHLQEARSNLGCTRGAQHFRKTFLRISTQWLHSMGRLRRPEPPRRAYAGLLDDFADWMARERGLSEGTIQNRRWHAGRFLAWLSGQRRRLHDLCLVDVDGFVHHLHASGFSRVTIKIYTNAVRAFVRHGERRGWCAAGLADSIHGPRIYRQHSLPTSPSWDDVKRLLDDATSNDPVDIRDHAVLLVFALYGLRAGEVARLSVEDIDWDNDQIRIPRQKQRRSHLYPLVPVVGQAIVRYLKFVRPKCADHHLFLKLLAPIGPMTAKSLYALVAARLKRLGIKTPRYGPHILRHACAGRLLSQGLSLKEIGDHLGHRSLDSTRIYAKVDLAGLREVAAFDLGRVL